MANSSDTATKQAAQRSDFAPVVQKRELGPARQRGVAGDSAARELRFPSRRNLLQRMRTLPERCVIDWVTHPMHELSLGVNVETRIVVPGEFQSTVFGVVSAADRIGPHAVQLSFTFTGQNRMECARLFAMACGHSNRAGFRRAPRYAIDAPAGLQIDGVSLPVQVADLSRRGAGLRLGQPLALAVGDRVRLRVRSGLFRHEVLESKVVWVRQRRGASEVGVQFVEVAPVSQRWLASQLVDLSAR